MQTEFFHRIWENIIFRPNDCLSDSSIRLNRVLSLNCIFSIRHSDHHSAYSFFSSIIKKKKKQQNHFLPLFPITPLNSSPSFPPVNRCLPKQILIQSQLGTIIKSPQLTTKVHFSIFIPALYVSPVSLAFIINPSCSFRVSFLILTTFSPTWSLPPLTFSRPFKLLKTHFSPSLSLWPFLVSLLRTYG